MNAKDPSGAFFREVAEFLKETVNQIGQALKAAAPVYAGFGAGTVIDGPLPFVDVLMLAGAGAVTVGIIGYGAYQAAKSISSPKAKEKDVVKVAPPKLQNDTVIYRYGKMNPGNFVPSQRDVDLFPTTGKGLSFSTIPKLGAAMTTIGALNATGIVYAVQDGENHVSVHPIGGTLADWHNAGSTSIWTTTVKSLCIKWDG